MSLFFKKTHKNFPVLLGIAFLFAFQASHAQTAPASPVLVTGDAPELELAQEETETANSQQTASWQDLLAQERDRAKAYFDAKIIQPIFSARLPLALPDSLEKLGEVLGELPLQS